MKTRYKFIVLSVILFTFGLVGVGYSQVGFFPPPNVAPRIALPLDLDDTFFANPFFAPNPFFPPRAFPPPFFFRPGFPSFAPGFGEVD